MSRNYGAKVITMCMGLSLCLQAPVTALAASPEFARTNRGVGQSSATMCWSMMNWKT